MQQLGTKFQSHSMLQVSSHRREGWPEILRTRQKVQLFETLRTLTW
jgi:hypothetical protein